MPAPARPCLDSWPVAFVNCNSAESGGVGCSHLDAMDDDSRDFVINAAVEYLWRWTGRRFGLCEVSIRPCAEDCRNNWAWPGTMYFGFPPLVMPYIRNGQWFNLFCGGCRKQRCSCDHLSTIVLPGPAYAVTEVLIDGQPLDPAAYRLDNLGLARIDGEAWPTCQDMAADPESAADTFMVTYQQGEPVPSGGALAAGTLACELAKQICNDGKCRLPRRAQTVAREGVTITLPNDEAFLSSGLTGLWEIDTFLTSVQEENRSGFKVTSPDRKSFRRVWPNA